VDLYLHTPIRLRKMVLKQWELLHGVIRNKAYGTSPLLFKNLFYSEAGFKKKKTQSNRDRLNLNLVEITPESITNIQLHYTFKKSSRGLHSL